MKNLTLLMCGVLVFFLFSCNKDNNEEDKAKAATELYYCAWKDSLVGKIELNNGNLNSIVAKGIADNISGRGPNGITTDGTNLYVALEVNDGAILKISTTGTVTVLYSGVDATIKPTAIVYNKKNNMLYWISEDASKIYYANTNGTGTPTSLFGNESIEADGYGLDIDLKTNKIYFTDWDNIWVGNLDGTGTPTKLYNTIYDTIESPSSILVDNTNNRLYYTDENTNVVAYANLDGTGNFHILFDYDNDDVDRADGLAIDFVTNKIYWSETFSGRIRVGNLDGTGTPTTLLIQDEVYKIILK
ncbi:MAG: hypothetical protein IPK18_03840 [Sphingobacteriales bacterium]|jgi:DNA-binding beta-propeller fold protein YncE|nr:MAG: hypothetical protein IPK18_03840 [Sphingobacteriales bacterium]